MCKPIPKKYIDGATLFGLGLTVAALQIQLKFTGFKGVVFLGCYWILLLAAIYTFLFVKK